MIWVLALALLATAVVTLVGDLVAASATLVALHQGALAVLALRLTYKRLF